MPHITKDGLQGIQEPLRELYPDKVNLASGNAGIDSWLSVWSNGILIENVDETGRDVKRFFKIEALHYCAAVKFVPQLANQQFNNPSAILPNGNSVALPKFLPLDSPHARMHMDDSNPPIFASILRRTTGVKVLECHAFICKREAAANALVRCCFHAYADTMYAKQIGADVDSIANDMNNNNNQNIGQAQILKRPSELRNVNVGAPSIIARRSKSIAALNETSDSSVNSGINQDSFRQHELNQKRSSRKNANENYSMNGGDVSDSGYSQQRTNINSALQKQNKMSKSMHHLNQLDQMNSPQYGQIGTYGGPNHAMSFHNLHKSQQQQHTPPPHQPFYNPYSSRVPSYPPEELIEQQANHSGTLRSIKSVAANSIASTLLRSKKHAKAMSMAQINNQEKITSFHQPYLPNGSTLGAGTFLMPPVPPMFLPNMPRTLINGSQTMKVPSRPMMPLAGPPINFEAMTPKEMKKLLKKSAKYGIDPSHFCENGLPVHPLRPIPLQMPPPLGCPMMPPLPQLASNKGGTIGSQSMYSLDLHRPMTNQDIPDMGTMQGLPMSSDHPQPIKSILVKPNPEFLKSKAGKKWLKQQKEFKKLLPPHLDGLPIVFGPPPIDALEPAAPLPNSQPPAFISPPPTQPGLPVMDSSGYYNPHPFYGPSGRASTASTLLRYSPHSQMLQDSAAANEAEYLRRNPNIYASSMLSTQAMLSPQQVHSQDYLGENSSTVFANNNYDIYSENRPYQFNGDLRRQKPRNHMVEQSVISLGDENDVEDGEKEDGGNSHDDAGASNGYYNQIEQQSSSHRPGRSRRTEQDSNGAYNHHNHRHRDSQQDYEQVMSSAADDQSSYSSGIYRRGHINERAFSYSIRQESNQSNGNSDNECVVGNGYVSDSDQVNHRGSYPTYDNPHHSQHTSEAYRRDSDQSTIDHYAHHRSGELRTLPVSELSSRLENQLNMKSFANSGVKSHI